MKSTFLFLAGSIVGALVIWFAFSKDIVILPSGTTLVEVNRFNGNAREVYYSHEEASRLRLEEGERMTKVLDEWEKAHQSPQLAVSASTPVAAGKEASELGAEDLALVKYTAKVTTGLSRSGLEYSIYNGTGKTLVLAQARVEGVNKESGLPLARDVKIPLTLSPSTDTNGAVSIQNGSIDSNKVEGLKVTLTKVLAQ